ncbi:MAG: zinc metalloprotease [Actinomycetales bacterium]|nr:MAG: zinc metalloprotease [Actinomycetales bacterium]
MLWILGILLIVVGIGLSIALHEIGHLLPAKLFGVKCTQYMVGFGKTIWSRKRGDTEYGIKAIPLGGYVRMIGMIPPRPGDQPGQLRDVSTGRFSGLIDQARHDSLIEVEPGDEDRVFYKLSVPKKIVVMLGGLTMNLLLALVLLVILISGVGVQSLVPRLSTVAECVPTAAPTVEAPLAECQPGDPLPPSAGVLQEGDTIVEVNGQPVTLWGEVTDVIRGSAGQSIDLVLDRNGERVPVTLTLATVQRAAFADDTRAEVKVNPDGTLVVETVGFLGASASIDFVRLPITEAPVKLVETVAATGQVLLTVPERLVNVWQTVTGQEERDPEGLISVVGVARAGGEIVAADLPIADQARAKAGFILGLLFGVNIALFLFNLLPMPPLDGGQLAGAVWEGIKRTGARLLGRPDPGYVDVAKGLPIAYAVSILLIAMTVLLVYADLVTPVRFT